MLFNYAVQFILSNFFWSLIKQVFQSIPLTFDISPLPLLYPPPCLRFLHSSHPCCRYLQTEFSKYRDPQFSIPGGGGNSRIPHAREDSKIPHARGGFNNPPYQGGGDFKFPPYRGDFTIPFTRGGGLHNPP